MDFKSYHTYKEILRQPENWEYVIKDIFEDNLFNPAILKNSYNYIIFFGCGSSYNLGQSASFFYRHLTGSTNSLAVPSSELIINPELYINESDKYLLIGFSRSGETTETINVLQNLQERKNVTSLSFTCKEKSSFSGVSNMNFTCRNAVEESIVMTTSFSSMLMAICAALIFA